MAGNLTAQVRNIAAVTTAVANGDLKQNLTVEAKGEIAALADTINNMIDTLATFADQVTTTAREVGVEGQLGGQASVPGAAGTWKDLTDNVNQLAANLTTQIRSIADVATAVTKGDLTRSIKVEAKGEVAALKDNINQMIRNLKDANLKNSEQDWLKTNLAEFSRMLQGQKDLLTVGKLILSELAPVVAAQQGVFYIIDAPEKEDIYLKLLASYAYRERKNASNKFNSLLILANQLADNTEKNLTAKQVEFARTIHSAGIDLLTLINDILDLSKIESGTVTIDVSELPFEQLQDHVNRTFRHVAEAKGLDFDIRLDDNLPATMQTDAKRLQQVMKNLLSNAFKFTERGKVEFAIRPAAEGWNRENENLNRAPSVIAFSVRDTGIGIPSDKQQIIFEAFQQAEGSTNRRFGGTGLGLAISRELAKLLGGEIRLESAPGHGSTLEQLISMLRVWLHR